MPPKYAQLVQALQRRIESGDYPPGALLPSENQLINEFGVSRPTVAAALRVLREQGWIDSQQGKGRFVRGRPAMTSMEQPRPGQAYLIAPESASQGEVIEAAALPAPNRVVSLLGLTPKSKAFLRRRLVSRDGEPTEMVSLWVPVELSEGTDLTSAEPLSQGLREHFQSRKGVRFDHVVEQITARMPTTDEAKRLGMPKNTPMLAVYGAVRDATGAALAVVEVLLPADRHELEDAYPIVWEASSLCTRGSDLLRASSSANPRPSYGSRTPRR
ncbi:GntR family transcriptional regulator [Streptosporangium sp. NPDC001681]|uniref:GntR family transcriptional regulator n=1 Tax=Streptosporangium sp. NPDC001681 TaxID=3154395 RepID=UPI0033277F12